MKPKFNNEELFVMSDATWNNLKEKEYEFANTQPDPIKYIKSLASLNVSIDNSLPFGMIEFWNKHDYEDFIREMNNE